MSYAELQVTSNFSFRLGGSHPEELVDTAADLGYQAIALTDRNTFAGVVRAYVVAKERDIKFIPGVRLDLIDGPSLLAYPTDRAAYSRLSNLLTVGNLRAEKEKCYLYKKDVYRCLMEKDVKGLLAWCVNKDGRWKYVPFHDRKLLASCTKYLTTSLWELVVHKLKKKK